MRADQPCCRGDALGVIAGTVGDDAALPLGVTQPGDTVIGTAKLERAGALQAFGLNKQPRAEPVVEPVIAQKRRAHRVTGQSLRGIKNVAMARQVENR